MESENPERKPTCPRAGTCQRGCILFSPVCLSSDTQWSRPRLAMVTTEKREWQFPKTGPVTAWQAARKTASRHPKRESSRADLGSLVSLKGLARHLQCTAYDYVPQEPEHPKIKVPFSRPSWKGEKMCLEIALLLNYISQLWALSEGLAIYCSDAIWGT